MVTHFWLKAALNFLVAASAAFVAASGNPPQDEWGWTLLVIGSFGAGCTALKAYLSDASTIRNQQP